jgi:hypothetical protein
MKVKAIGMMMLRENENGHHKFEGKRREKYSLSWPMQRLSTTKTKFKQH